MIWAKGENSYIETRKCAILVHIEEQVDENLWRPTGELLPASMSFVSTGHSFWKGLMFQMNRRSTGPGNGRADMWLTRWRLFSRFVPGVKGSHYRWWETCEGWVENTRQQNEGEALFKAFERGEKQMGVDDDQGGVSDDAAPANAAGVM